MGLINRKGTVESAVSLDQPSPPLDHEKQMIDRDSSDGPKGNPRFDDMKDPHSRLHRGLKARQVTMIAIGGAMYAIFSQSRSTAIDGSSAELA